MNETDPAVVQIKHEAMEDFLTATHNGMKKGELKTVSDGGSSAGFKVTVYEAGGGVWYAEDSRDGTTGTGAVPSKALQTLAEKLYP